MHHEHSRGVRIKNPEAAYRSFPSLSSSLQDTGGRQESSGTHRGDDVAVEPVRKSHSLWFLHACCCVVQVSTPSSYSLTIGFGCGSDGVELVLRRHQADRCLYAVVRVVAGAACVEVGHGGREAVLVEETSDARVRHAAPAVVVAVEQTGDDGDLRVT